MNIDTMDMNMIFHRKLPIPQELKQRFPLNDAILTAKKKRDPEISRIIKGESDRFLLVIGPCSADNESSVLDYVTRLSRLSEQVEEKIWIVPRVYTSKPRSTGESYKGLLHQPNPEEKPDLLQGLISIRKIHQRIITETGLTCADEMLYPDLFRYVSDLVSYLVIGSRSAEDQEHRLVASGSGVPTGIKNPMNGNLTSMLQSIEAAHQRHTFVYRGWEVQSLGNDCAHGILRGFVGSDGSDHTNYTYESLLHFADLCCGFHDKYESHPNCTDIPVIPPIIIDTNHSNSSKNYLLQQEIAKDVIISRKKSPDLKHMVRGLMIESYIEDGSQKLGGSVYGQSITDPCLGWKKTERLVLELAEML